MELKILLGDNINLLKQYPNNYFDSVVTDCPYGLGKEPNALKLLQDWIDHGYHEIKGKGFMGKSWDAFVPQPLFWKEVFRVLKPGGYVLAFFGTRTYDWGTLAIRLSGFEIRDMITYHYGNGFPKSLNIKKSANDKCCECPEMANRQESEYDLCNLPKENLQETFSDKNTNSDILQSGMQEQSEFRTMKGDKPEKSIENGKESRLERRNNHIQEKGELYQREVCESTGMGETNGEEGRVYNGTSINNGNPNKETINQDGSSSSHRSQSDKQSSPKFTSLPEQQHTQESRTREICDVCGKPIIDGGIGTALKPATEPICVARKPIEGTVAENILKYGTGGINLDGCRIETEDSLNGGGSLTKVAKGWDRPFRHNKESKDKYRISDKDKLEKAEELGRFPANVIFDPFMADELDKQSGESQSSGGRKGENGKRNYLDNTISNSLSGTRSNTSQKYTDPIRGEYQLGKVHNDSGGASRFFYCAKSSQFERNAGCENLTQIINIGHSRFDKCKNCGGYLIQGENRDSKCICDNPESENQIGIQNHHPTVKPISLMSYLQRLVTPPGGKTLDPFAGSGTSGCSAYFENIGEIVLMEMDETYLPIIEARTKYWSIERNRINYLDEIRVKKDEPIENQMKLF